jgi:hypothetical protein
MQPTGIPRRDLLRLTLGGSAGAMLASKLGFAWPGPAPDARAKAKHVILLWMGGGPSQLDTWDPKPGTETGGPVKAIDTSVPGVRIAEHLPRMARALDQAALVRTVHSNDPNHQTAVFMLHTGYKKENTVDFPHFGCMIAREIGDAAFDLPHVVRVGSDDGGVGPGYLGPGFSPLVMPDINDPLKDIRIPDRVGKDQFAARASLLEKQNREFAVPRADSRGIQTHQKTYERALRMINSERIAAFDINREPDEARRRYGETPFGRACLMARRLVETGVTFVEVDLGGWDTHVNNHAGHTALLDQVDPGMAALLGDLKERRLLDETLVVWMGEFGRTPRINEQNGRDHFTRAWSVVLAGGGIQPGRVIGRTDATGRDVEEHPVSVQDLFATMYHCLGIDTAKEYKSNLGRPIKILDKGAPVKDLIS